MAELFSTPAELSALRLRLELPADAPELVVKAEAMLALGLAGELVAEVDRVLNPEVEYLATALQVGWAWWAIED